MFVVVFSTYIEATDDPRRSTALKMNHSDEDVTSKSACTDHNSETLHAAIQDSRWNATSIHFIQTTPLYTSQPRGKHKVCMERREIGTHLRVARRFQRYRSIIPSMRLTIHSNTRALLRGGGVPRWIRCAILSKIRPGCYINLLQ